MQIDECYGCTKRKLGCRSDCIYWKTHEKEKAKRYADEKIKRDAGLKTKTILYYNSYSAKNQSRRMIKSEI